MTRSSFSRRTASSSSWPTAGSRAAGGCCPPSDRTWPAWSRPGRSPGERSPDAAELLAAPWRGPDPAALGAPLKLRHEKAREAAADARTGDGRRPARTPTPRPARGTHGGHAGRGRGGDDRRRGPLDRSRPVRRRGMRPIVEAVVADESGSMKVAFFNQPWLVSKYPTGTRLVLHGSRDARGRFRVTSHAPTNEGVGRGDGGRPLPGDGRPLVDADPRARPGAPAGRARRARAAARPPARAPPAAGPRERAARRPFRRPRGRAPPAGLRGAAARPARPAAPAPSPPRRGRRRGAGGRGGRARRAAGWAGSSRSQPTGDQERAIDALFADLAEPRPMQRLLMGEVGSGKTVVALAGDAAGRRARPPGGADGADRGARRAALRDAPGADARRGGAGRAADGLHAGRAARRHPRQARQRRAAR